MRGRATMILLPAVCLLCAASWAATLGGLGDLVLGPREFKGVTNFSTFLLDRTTGMLFMGARDAILALDTNNLQQPVKKIVWDVPERKRQSCVTKGKTEVDCNNYIRLLQFLGDGRIYVCGTYAFDPQCAFLELSTFTLERAQDGGVRMETGKGKCPFEPSQHYTAVMADGTLYTAATSNFLGTLFDISRATGPEQGRIRTEQSINWLNDPEFVSSAFIQQSAESNPTGDDDKIYFFFTEVAKEYDLYTKVKVPRVARVCKSDVGGMKTLQRRWTTFLKAQLVCEDKPSGQRYNVLTDVFTTQQTPGDPSSTHFYGLFTSQWEREELSAVCVFSLSDINKVLNGPFKELKKTSENWINPEPVPTPRPGQCLNDALKAEGFETSLKLPDKVLTFVRDHPLMENSVSAAPLLVRKGITYTKLAVTQAERKGAVLHLGTDRGELHRVAVVDQNTTLLQEIPLFPSQEPINNILLHQGRALVGSPLYLARVSAEGCGLYPSCEVCARARGLGCEWNTKEEVCKETTAEPGSGDIVDEALRKCVIGEGEFISFVPTSNKRNSLLKFPCGLQVAAVPPSERCASLWACVSCCRASSSPPGPVAGSILLTDTPGSTTQAWRWWSQRRASENTSAPARCVMNASERQHQVACYVNSGKLCPAGGGTERQRSHPLPESRVPADSGRPHRRGGGGGGREPSCCGGLHPPVLFGFGVGHVPPVLPDPPTQPPLPGPPPARQFRVLGEGPGVAGLVGHAAVPEQRHPAVGGLHADGENATGRRPPPPRRPRCTAARVTAATITAARSSAATQATATATPSTATAGEAAAA
uniref:Sema domain-containing protein n=1 Tax=Takifugu rubripes TaxID=31033 RepID=H2T8E5_TAKRU